MSEKMNPTCKICGKPLTVPEHIAQGMGPECAAKLAAHGGSFDDIIMNRVVVSELPEGYIPGKVVFKAIHDAGLSPSSFLKKVVGGQRYPDPIDPIFLPIYFKGERFFLAQVLNATNMQWITEILSERKNKAPKAPKEKAPEEKASKELKKKLPAKKAKKAKEVEGMAPPVLSWDSPESPKSPEDVVDL